MTEPLYISSTCVISNDAVYKNGQKVFADHGAKDVLEFLNNAYKGLQLSYPKFYKMDNLCKLGWLSAEVLVNFKTGEELQDGARIPNADPSSVAVLLINSSSSLDTDIRYYQTVDQMASPALFVYTLPNIVIGEICIRNGWKGENAFFISESFEPAFLYDQVRLMFSDEYNRTCICGWVELLGNDYKSCLFSVEKENDGQSINFTKRNIEKVFNNPANTFFENDIKITS